MNRVLGWFSRLFPGRAGIRLRCAAFEGVASAFHSGRQWRRTRNAYIARHPCCAMCGTRKKLEAHHIVPWHRSELLRYAESNLITLCREDHFRFGHWRNWRESNPDINELSAFTAKLREKQA